jgi:hypothetical protein
MIQEIDLNKLSFPDEWARFPMHTLAESRIFLGKEYKEDLPEFVGCVSYRFDDKFKPKPGLVDIVSMLGHRSLSAKDVWGIQFGSRNWIEDCERVHPGMQVLLEEVAHRFQLEFVPDGPAPCCNTFICHRDQYVELCEFMSQALRYVLEKYGDHLPYTYACACCGEANETGLGRYRNNDRHAGFFAERLTMLYFSSKVGRRKRHFSMITLGGKAKAAVKILLEPLVPLIKKGIRWVRS